MNRSESTILILNSSLTKRMHNTLYDLTNIESIQFTVK